MKNLNNLDNQMNKSEFEQCHKINYNLFFTKFKSASIEDFSTDYTTIFPDMYLMISQ